MSDLVCEIANQTLLIGQATMCVHASYPIAYMQDLHVCAGMRCNQ